MKTVFIYALKCPTTGRVRYVGKSKNPEQRLKSHLRDTKNNRRTCWLRSLLVKELRPVMEILDEITDEFWPQWEVAWIEYFREQGFALVNGTAGGEDPPSSAGKKLSSEECARRSASMQGNKHPQFGKHPSEETRAKMRRNSSMRGKQYSLEERAKMSAAQSGKKHHGFGKKRSVESRAKQGASTLGKKNHFFGKKHSAATRAKMVKSWGLRRARLSDLTTAPE